MSNRLARLRRLTTPAGMREAAEVQRRRRGDLTTHPYVVGGLRLVAGQIVLFGVEQGPALNIIRPIRLTAVAALHYRWRTKQAAAQFIGRHQLADVHVWHTGWLDVLEVDPVATGQPAPSEAPLPAGQVAGVGPDPR